MYGAAVGQIEIRSRDSSMLENFFLALLMRYLKIFSVQTFSVDAFWVNFKMNASVGTQEIRFG